jgi:hypothetical protein
LLFPDWRGYLISALVRVADVYMGVFADLRLDIQPERIEIKSKNLELQSKEEEIGSQRAA